MAKIVLVLGSSPDALRAQHFNGDIFSDIVAVNNAWKIRDDWDYLLHAGDFPDERRPLKSSLKSGQVRLSHEAYVPANNAFGGIVYAGGTMAFSTAYWVLHRLKPDIIAFCGCDMVYSQTNSPSHFYGNGTADPLRADPTLQNLEAKANRLMLLASFENCMCLNLSVLPESRLTFPRTSTKELSSISTRIHTNLLKDLVARQDKTTIQQAQMMERQLGCFVEGGDYWNHPDLVDCKGLDAIDRAWYASFEKTKQFNQVAL